MNIKEKFIRKIIDELNRVNHKRIYKDETPLNICFLISVVDQQIESCSEFMEDITKNSFYINGYEEDKTEGYTDGKISILLEKPDEEKESEYMVDAYCDYHYELEFNSDERMWGYCQCTHEDSGYNEKHGCCGYGCDWVAPAFYLRKIIEFNGSRWDGYAKDYWEYEEKFNENESNKNKEVEEYNIRQQKERIENQIKELQEKLNKL